MSAEVLMANEPTTPGAKRPADRDKRKSTGKVKREGLAGKVEREASGRRVVSVGKPFELGSLAEAAGIPLRPVALAEKIIRPASDGSVMVKKSDLLALLRAANAAAQRPRSTKPKPRPVPAAKAKPSPPRMLSKRETELLTRINVGLSEDKAKRLEALNDRVDVEDPFPPAEYAELLALVDESEALAVGRTEALIELAAIRGVPLNTLMRDLGLQGAARG